MWLEMAVVALAEPISPELALVCPELRERALALLPDPRPFRPAEPAADAQPEPLPPLAVGLVVYVAARATATAVEGALLAAFIVALALLLPALA